MGRSAALSRSVQAEESSEYQDPPSKAAAADDEEEEEEPSQGVPGDLRVQLRWQPGQQILCMHMRQSLLSPRLQMKCSSFLNPQTGEDICTPALLAAVKRLLKPWSRKV